MAIKITWLEPTEDTITKIYIYKATTIYGSYSELTNIDATSDGEAKSSSNTWVTSYTDSVGTRDNWYKIRMYDGTSLLYSEYSDPVTGEELLQLCTVAQVKKFLDTTGRWTDDEVFEMITEIDDLIYVEGGTPLQSVYCDVGKTDTTIQDTYYVGEENIHRIDRVFYGTATKFELYMDDGYKANNNYGMIRVLPVASSGVTLTTDMELEIHYVPRLYNKLSIYRTVKALLEQTDYVSGDNTSKSLQVIESKLKMVETLLMHRVGVQLSSDVANYDGRYGVNMKKIEQDHRRNKYIGSTNWN